MTDNSAKSQIQAGGFVHCVFFWLKEPGNPAACKEFEHHLTGFIRSSAYVKSSHIGTMEASHRDVVDQSYSYCLIATFESKQAQDQYQDEAVHIQFVNEAQHLWEKVVVYDSNSIL